jgi:aerobic carbon-monoxide dehydrogenase small subunit
VNGQVHALQIAPAETLANVLRSRLHLTGTKLGCESGTCGSCSVLVDGILKNACLTLAVFVDGREVTTIEGLADGDSLHPVQEAFVQSGAIQCGFCTPGMVMATVALLDKNPRPSESEIREGLAGNLCRCTGYQKIFDAVRKASSAITVPAETAGKTSEHRPAPAVFPGDRP